MAESSVEIPTEPAWLSKLESRRELLSKSKIGHETGAGAPCTVCGDDCPGLDLHFWRKLCRNCKCRKDQHDVPNEDLSGWAQFELLGAVRSKPAFLKIKALENQAVHLDWVPPNVSQELATDYMNQLGTDQIPVTGSIAATRRKQQLEYQVPPHDLDPSLCHNLTNVEKSLFDEHIAKIMSNSGQGYVTRLGIKHESIKGLIDLVNSSDYELGQKYNPIDNKKISIDNYKSHMNDLFDESGRVLIKHESIKNPVDLVNSTDYELGQKYNPIDNKSPIRIYTNDIFDESNKPILESINRDKILMGLLNSEIVKGIRFHPVMRFTGRKLQTQDYLGNKYSTNEDFRNIPILSSIVKDKLNSLKISSESVQSAVLHGWCYDKILKDLDNFQIDYSEDLLIKPIQEFRAEYLTNDEFKNELNNYAVQLPGDILRESFDKINFDNRNIRTDIHGNDVPPAINYATFPNLNKSNIPDKKLNHAELTNILENFKKPELLQPIYQQQLLETPQYAKNLSDGKNINDTKNISDSITQNLHDLKITQMKCHQCTIEIKPGEVTVQIEKSGKNHIYHPKCFICHSCKELLADLVYFYHKNHLYCARHYAEILKIPRCKACDELIFTSEYTLAESSNFHVKHFCCFNCDKPLADENYIPDDKTGQPLCLLCYEVYRAEKCEFCNKVIAANEQGVAWGGVHWHAGCFNCGGVDCGKSLLGGRFMVKNNLPLCSASCVKSLKL